MKGAGGQNNNLCKKLLGDTIVSSLVGKSTSFIGKSTKICKEMAGENDLFFTLKISIGPVLDEIAVSKYQYPRERVLDFLHKKFIMFLL